MPSNVSADAATVAQFAKTIKTLKAKTLDLAELKDERSAGIIIIARAILLIDQTL